jgi:hypothetical protein
MSVITIQNHRLIGPRIFKVRACEPRIRTCLAIVTRAQQSESNGGEEAAGKEKGWLAGFLDFNSWAPRSARMWRLNQYDYESSTSGSDEENGKSSPIQSCLVIYWPSCPVNSSVDYCSVSIDKAARAMCMTLKSSICANSTGIALPVTVWPTVDDHSSSCSFPQKASRI